MYVWDCLEKGEFEVPNHHSLSCSPTKSEVLFCGTRANIDTTHWIRSVLVAGCEIEPSDTIKSLGITLDGQLNFDKHVDGVCRMAHFHIRALKHIRRTLSVDCAKSVSSAIVGSRLDYCNGILYGVSAKNIKKLKMVQNTLVRVVMGGRRRDSITPMLRDLHWLPVSKRIEFKVATLTFKIKSTGQPEYLSSLLSDYAPTRTLRSAQLQTLVVPRSRTVLAERRFSVAAPTIWNNIPLDIRQSLTVQSFKRHLKTYYFKSVFI